MVLAMGIDPGTAILGYGLVREENRELSLVEFGAVRTASSLSMPERLCQLYDGLREIIRRQSPDVVVVEELFFSKNARTALAVGQARGAALLAAAKSDIQVREYTPLQVKQAVVGYGRATKEQVQEMVKVLLGLSAVPQPDDAADALAIAICHLHSVDFAELAEPAG